MRILMVTESFHPIVGGSEMAIHYLSEALMAKGHEVMVAVMNVPNASACSDKYAFCTISPRMGVLDLKTVGKIRHCTNIVRAFRPDIVNAHFLFESGYVGTAAGHRCGVPSVVSIRGRGIFFRPRNVLERVLSSWWIHGALQADDFIATSQEMADIACGRWGIHPTVISNGVDARAFHPNRIKDIRSPLGIHTQQPVIFCARRLVPKNGIEYIIRALPLIRQHVDAVLLLAAKKSAEHETLHAIALELGVGDAVYFLGPLDHTELPYYFCGADVVVQPSIAEARSLSCLEAMACGAAIVATATGGLKELLTHKHSGYLIDPFEESTYQVHAIQEGGVQRLASAVLSLLQDRVLCERIKRGAYEATQQYRWDTIAEESLRVYRQALDRFHSKK